MLCRDIHEMQRARDGLHDIDDRQQMVTVPLQLRDPALRLLDGGDRLLFGDLSHVRAPGGLTRQKFGGLDGVESRRYNPKVKN